MAFDWTPENLESLRLRYPQEGVGPFLSELSLSSATIHKKARELGLKKIRKGFEWTSERKRLILERYPKEGSTKLAVEFGLHGSTIYKKAKELGAFLSQKESIRRTQRNRIIQLKEEGKEKVKNFLDHGILSILIFLA
jgi:hypothetical protein